MSWGIDVTGTKAGATAKVTEYLDKAAATYAGQPEADDIAAAKARILALIAATDLTPDGYVDWNAVNVKASGSHSRSDKGLWSGNFSISVTRTSVAFDPPAPAST